MQAQYPGVEAPIDSDEFLKQRRNLIITSLVVAFYSSAGLRFDELNLLGNKVSLANPEIITYSLYVSLAYFMIRFYQFGALDNLNVWIRNRLFAIHGSSLFYLALPTIKQVTYKNEPVKDVVKPTVTELTITATCAWHFRFLSELVVRTKVYSTYVLPFHLSFIAVFLVVSNQFFWGGIIYSTAMLIAFLGMLVKWQLHTLRSVQKLHQDLDDLETY